MRSVAHRFLVALSVLSFAALPRAARAQAVTITQAEALYNQGKELIEKKRFHEACDKFAASLKLDETVNTHVSLARCLELDGRLASAWGEYLVASKKGAGTPAGTYAAQQASALEPKLLKATLLIASPPTDLTLSLDGSAIPVESLGSELPLDAGDHVLVASSSKTRPLTRRFKLEAAASPLKVSLTLEAKSEEELKRDSEKKVVVVKSGATEWSTMKTAGLVLGIVGAGAAIGAGVFGYLTIDRNDVANVAYGECQTAGKIAATCAPGNDAHDRALTFQAVAIGAGAGAALLIGAGATMFIVGGNKPAPAGRDDVEKTATLTRIVPLVSPSLGGVALQGTF